MILKLYKQDNFIYYNFHIILIKQKINNIKEMLMEFNMENRKWKWKQKEEYLVKGKNIRRNNQIKVKSGKNKKVLRIQSDTIILK